jgi:hypothetical protein
MNVKWNMRDSTHTLATAASTGALAPRAESSPVPALPREASEVFDAALAMALPPRREPCWDPPWIDASRANRMAPRCRPASRSPGVHSDA